MPIVNDKVIATLNDLIETSKDGEKGLALAARATQEPELNEVFRQGEQSYRDAVAELQDQVRQLGGDATEFGSMKAAAHRGWISLKTAMSSRDDMAILEECERGEDYAKARYGAALNVDLPESVRSVVERQYAGVKANHDRIRDLRNRFRDRAPRAIRSNV
jgi:uncharacterized protein (TIGR02284 family)